MNNRASHFLWKNKIRLMRNTIRHWWLPLLGILITAIFTVYQVMSFFPSVEQLLVFCRRNRRYVYAIMACYCFLRIYCVKNPVYKINAATLLYFYNTVQLTKLLRKKSFISFLSHGILSIGLTLCVHEYVACGLWGLNALKLFFFLRGSWLIAWIFYHEVGVGRMIAGLIFPVMIPLIFVESFVSLLICLGVYIVALFYTEKCLAINFPKYYDRMHYIDRVEAAQSQNNLAAMAQIAEENRPATVVGIKLQHFHLTKKTALVAKGVLDLMRTQSQIWMIVIAFPIIGWVLVNTSVLDFLGIHIDPTLISMLSAILTMVAFTSLFQVISKQIHKMVEKKKTGLELPFTTIQMFWGYFPVALISNLLLTLGLNVAYACFSLTSVGFYLVANATYLIYAYSTVYSPRCSGILSSASGTVLLVCIFIHYTL